MNFHRAMLYLLTLILILGEATSSLAQRRGNTTEFDCLNAWGDLIDKQMFNELDPNTEEQVERIG